MAKRTISAALIDMHRDINVYHGWWDCIFDWVKEEQEAKGFTVSNIYFSGFCSQGDGACFEGSVLDSGLFMREHSLTDKYPWVAKLLDKGGEWNLRVTHQGHYNHSGCTEFYFEWLKFSHVLDTSIDLMASIIDVWDEELDKEIPGFEDEVTRILRSAMDDCYRRLEQEYDFLTSDEQVREALEANEIYDEDEDEDEDEICTA